MYHLTKYIQCEPERDYGYFETLEDAMEAANIVEGETVWFWKTRPDVWQQNDNNGKIDEPYIIVKVSTISLDEFKKLYSRK